MAFKFVTFCALLAIANAGGLVHHPETYTQIQSEEAHQSQQYSHQEQDGSHHVHYVPAFTKTVHFSSSPVHSSPVYTAPALKYVTYGAPSYLRSLAFHEGPSSTSSTPSEETTTPETTTIESSTAEAENKIETTHASRSVADEPEPTQASYQQQTATASGYSYDAPSSSLPAPVSHEGQSQNFVKYQTSYHHAAGHHLSAPSVVKYEVPAQTVVKYAAPASAPHHLVHYTAAPVQTVYHKSVAPQSVHVKYINSEPAVYTSFGEHPPSAVYSHHSAQPVHHSYAVHQPQPALIKYSASAAPSQVTYIAPAPAVYTKYGVEQPTSQPAAAPQTYIKYDSPAPITAHTTYAVPQHSAETSSIKLIKYEAAPETSQSSKSQSHEANKESVEVNAAEASTGSHQPSSRAYLPPATYYNYQAPVEQQHSGHEESARSHSNEQNIWSTDGAASHVSFKGFGTSYVY